MSTVNKGLQKAFNIEEGEGSSVIFLLTQSFFIGIFYGIFDVAAHSVFLKVYEETMIAKAYLISGLAGILITSLYTSMQSRMMFSRLASLNLLFIFILTLALRFGFQIMNVKLLAFLLIVFMGPLKINAIVGFSGTVVRMFTLRQGKRLFGLIDSGQVLGVIISGYAITIILGFEFAVKNLFYISAISVLLAVLVQFIISRRFKLDTHTAVSTEESHEPKSDAGETKFSSLFKSKYIVYMSIFVIASMLAAFFLQYSLLAVSKENFPDNRDFTKFLGAFMATLMVFTLILKTFVYSKFIKTYGLKVILLLAPVVIGLFTVIASIIGSFFGYTKEAGGFTFFFLVIALSRLFVQTFKEAFEIPSFKLLYQSLSIKIRHAVQARIDGTINEFAAVFAGLLLTLMVTIPFVRVIHFSYILLIILGIWAIIAVRLYREYRRALEKSLAEAKTTDTEIYTTTSDRHSQFISSIDKGTPEQILNTLSFIEKTEPGFYDYALVTALQSSSKEVRETALNNLQNFKDTITADTIEKGLSSLSEADLKKSLQKLSEEIQKNNRFTTNDQILQLSKSREPNDRIKAVNMITQSKDKSLLSVYNILLRDLHPEVKISALKNSPKTEFTETTPILIDYLSSPQYYSFAYDALLVFNEAAFDSLEHGFYKTGLENKVLTRIIKLISFINNERSTEFLLSKMTHYNRDILKECINGLRLKEYQANDQSFIQIQQAITNTISVAAWNLAAKFSLDLNVLNSNIIEAIDEEVKDTNDMLFDLLSLAYEPQSVMHVRENLESGTSEGIGFAIELLDLFLAEELKPTLFPLLDDTSLADKIKHLQDEFPIEKMETEELLLSIINRDYNTINIYTKYCAIDNLKNVPDFEINDTLIAQLFNPHKILNEAACSYIHKNAPELLQSITPRMDESILAGIEKSIMQSTSLRHHLLSSKVNYLKSYTVFSDLPGKQLVALAELIEDIELSKDTQYNISTQEPLAFCIVRLGKIAIDSSNGESLIEISKFKSFNFYSIKQIQEYSLKAIEDSYIYTIKQDALNELIFDNKVINDILLNATLVESDSSLTLIENPV